MRWRILYRVAAASKLRCCRLFLPNNATTPSRSHCRTSALADPANVEIGRHDRQVTVPVRGAFCQVIRRDVLASGGQA